MTMAHLAREARTGCAASQSSRLVLSDDSELERSNNLIANSQQVCRSRSSWYLHQISRMIRVGQAGVEEWPWCPGVYHPTLEPERIHDQVF